MESTTSIATLSAISYANSEVFRAGASGVFVPGCLALCIGRPIDIAATILVALATYLMVCGMGGHMFVFGHRRFVLMIIVGAMLRAALVSIGDCVPNVLGDEQWQHVFGNVMPGVIAFSLDRQGVAHALGSIVPLTVLIRLTLIVIGIEVIS